MCSAPVAAIDWLRVSDSIALWVEGLALLAIFIWDRKDHREDHDETIEQMKVMSRNAVAAEVAANAAKDNIELLISKERARLVVDLDELDLSPHQGIYEVRFKISILGTTPALIVDTKCAAYIVSEDWVAHEETSDRVMLALRYVPSIIPANSAPIEEFAILTAASYEDSELLIGEVKASKLFVGIRGVIVYKDVFDRERKTSFRYVWRPSLISGIGGEWKKCGNPEENNAT
jgi:hypothetical protein